MKGFASALFVLAAATGALSQSIGPEVDASEQFGILTIHSTAINVHLQTWSLNGQQVILTKGANLTMTLDKNGLIWDQNGDVCAVSKADGSINFLPPTAITSDYITGPWSSSGSEQAAVSLDGYTAYGCENTTASAYQMYCFSTTPAQPSCTNVLLQPVNGNGIVSTLTTPTATASSSSAASSAASSTSSVAVVTTTATSTASAAVTTKTAAPATTSATVFTGGASAKSVMIAGIVAIAGFAGLLIA